MTPGTIISDTQFRFSDGTIGQKLMIILNDGTTGKYIVIKTTSQPKRKGRKTGCQSDDYYPNFYLPDGSCCLRGESWLMLNEFFEFDTSHMLRGKFSGRMKHIGILPTDIVKELLDCAINCQDISLAQEQTLIDMRNNLS